jgi:hypothetical protein
MAREATLRELVIEKYCRMLAERGEEVTIVSEHQRPKPQLATDHWGEVVRLERA